MSGMIIPGLNPLHHVRSTVTFDGTAGGGEAGTAVTIFTTTGRVLITHMTMFCTTGLSESAPTATIEAGGATNSTAALLAQMNAVDIDTNEWVSAGGTASAGYARQNAASIMDGEAAGASQDVAFTIGAANVTGGVIVVDAWYVPVTDGASLA